MKGRYMGSSFLTDSVTSMNVDAAIRCCLFNSFLVGTIPIYMNYDLLRLTVPLFLFSFLEESVDHIYLLLLLFYSFS